MAKSTANKALAAAQQKLKLQGPTIRRLSLKLREYSVENLDLAERNKRQAETIQQYRSRVATAEATVEQHRSRVARYEEALTQTEINNSELNQRLSDVQQRLDRADTLLASVQRLHREEVQDLKDAVTLERAYAKAAQNASAKALSDYASKISLVGTVAVASIIAAYLAGIATQHWFPINF